MRLTTADPVPAMIRSAGILASTFRSSGRGSTVPLSEANPGDITRKAGELIPAVQTGCRVLIPDRADAPRVQARGGERCGRHVA